MIKADGSFELEFIDDSAPGVFIPIVTIVRCRFSQAAATHFSGLMRDNSAEKAEVLLRAAVIRRQRIAGPQAKELLVTLLDFRR